MFDLLMRTERHRTKGLASSRPVLIFNPLDVSPTSLILRSRGTARRSAGDMDCIQHHCRRKLAGVGGMVWSGSRALRARFEAWEARIFQVRCRASSPQFFRICGPRSVPIDAQKSADFLCGASVLLTG